MEMNFCRRCAAPLTHQSGKVYECASGHTMFASPAPTVGIFFLTPEHEVIVSVRGIEPRKGMLDSFGGFVDDEESLEEASVRELTEELGLRATDYEPLQYLTSAVGHYPYQGETQQLVSAFYWTRLKAGVTLEPQDDVAAAETIPLHEVDMDRLHDEDIRDGIRALQALFPKEES
jgi:ADP-ribose pyrophosphatase YjhB (NUDIX family)